jgi:hypothetical protein
VRRSPALSWRGRRVVAPVDAGQVRSDSECQYELTEAALVLVTVPPHPHRRAVASAERSPASPARSERLEWRGGLAQWALAMVEFHRVMTIRATASAARAAPHALSGADDRAPIEAIQVGRPRRYMCVHVHACACMCMRVRACA